MNDQAPLISLKNVSFAPRTHPDRWIVKNVSLDVFQGEVIVLMGPSGSGKTTLLKIMKGLIPHVVKGKWKGSVTINGRVLDETALFELASTVGFIFQEPEFQVVGKNVFHELAFGLEVQNVDPEKVVNRVVEAAVQWNLSRHAFKPLHTLSGGELRLVTLVSSLMLQPLVLLWDEMLSFLDQQNRLLVLEAMKTLIDKSNKRVSIVMATHEMDDLLPLATRIIYVENGEIKHDGDPDEVLDVLITKSKSSINIPSYHAISRFLKEKGLINGEKASLPSSLDRLEWSRATCAHLNKQLNKQRS